jgi:hypothetical protein
MQLLHELLALLQAVSIDRLQECKCWKSHHQDDQQPEGHCARHHEEFVGTGCTEVPRPREEFPGTGCPRLPRARFTIAGETEKHPVSTNKHAQTLPDVTNTLTKTLPSPKHDRSGLASRYYVLYC